MKENKRIQKYMETYKRILNDKPISKQEFCEFERLFCDRIKNQNYLKEEVITPVLFHPFAHPDNIVDAICKSKNAYLICFIAYSVKDADKKLLEEAILQTKNVDYIYSFAYHNGCSDVKKFESIVYQSENVKQIVNFLLDIKGANTSLAIKRIFEIGDMNKIFHYMNSEPKLSSMIYQELLQGEISIQNYDEQKKEQFYLLVKKALRMLKSGDIIPREQMISTALNYGMSIEEILEALREAKFDINFMIHLISILEQYGIHKDLQELMQLCHQNQILIYGTLEKEKMMEWKEWLINLSLTEQNLLLGTVSYIKEQPENGEKYLEMLKLLQEEKYLWYEEAFENKIGFDDCDACYSYQYLLKTPNKMKK